MESQLELMFEVIKLIKLKFHLQSMEMVCIFIP